MVAVSWVAMACALVARNPNMATVHAILRVFLLPILAFAVIVGPLPFQPVMAGPGDFKWAFVLGCWVATGLAADLVFGGLAWRRLHTRFRQLAAQPSTPARAQPPRPADTGAPHTVSEIPRFQHLLTGLPSPPHPVRTTPPNA
jgi:hypothetical protein